MNKYDGDVYGMGADGGGAATGGGYPAAKAGRGAGGGDAGGLGANWERRDQLNSTVQGMEMGGSARKIICRVSPPAAAGAWRSSAAVQKAWAPRATGMEQVLRRRGQVVRRRGQVLRRQGQVVRRRGQKGKKKGRNRGKQASGRARQRGAKRAGEEGS